MTRLTNEWTETLDEAFAVTGPKGRKGEEFLMKVFESWGWDTKRNESDYKAQMDGKDIEFRAPSWYNYYSCDVKANLQNSGKFFVYMDWLYKVNCDRIFHVNPETGMIVWYGVKEMRQHVQTLDKAYRHVYNINSQLPGFMVSRQVRL